MTTGIASAALNAYEPFNYTLGTFANNTATTGSGFTGNWTCGAAGTIVSGLTYTALPVANNALNSGSGRQFVSFSNPLSSGTKYISFLYKASGNMGGNIDGVFFPNGNSTCLWFGFGLGPFSGTQGQLGIGSMTTAGTGATGASSLTQIGLGNYGNTYLIVLKIDFNTSGANDTITIYTNPVANASSPGVAAAGTFSSYDVGTISGIGLNVQGGATITVDEIRVGDTYGDVVGFVPPPAAPTGLTATPGVNSVGLSWNATSGATGYNVLRGTSTGVYTVTNSVPSNTNYDTTVVGGTTYFYVVQATNSSGASANSSEVSATPTIALPGAPSGLTATGTNSAVNLSWNPGSGAASYNVKRSTTSGGEVTIANVAVTSYSDTAVVNGTPYFYVVSSTNAAGEGANSSEVTATPNTPPAAPTGVIATAGSNQVSLSWTGSAGAVSYNIKRSTTSGSGYSTIGTTTDPTVNFIDSTAVKFTQYFYVVSAVNAYGESANSSPEATATPTGAYGPSAYESFNYALGAFPNNTPSTAVGFTGNWTVSGGPTIVAGLSYPSLPTSANAYQHSAAGSQTTVNLANPLSSGTKFVSFLFKGSGNSGGDTVGVFFKGNNANSLFAGFHVPDTATQTGFGIGTVNSTVLGGATGLGSAVDIDNTAVHFIVLEIDFNTSGANDTVSLWIDPPAGVISPGVAANVVNSSFDVGTISAFGINITGGYSPIIDEVRIGDVYGDVVGYNAVSTPTIPTTVAISVAQGEQVSWTAASTNSYQPQKSLDNSNWVNFGGFFVGNAVTSVYETTPEPYYRVLELVAGGPGPNVMVNGSFEIPAANNIGAANWNGPLSDGNANQYVTNQYGALLPTDGTNMLFMEGTNGTGAVVSSDLFPISGGLTYQVLFDAVNPVMLNGGNPQYQIQFFDTNNAFISGTGFGSLISVGSTWTTISNNYAAPANAASMSIEFLEAVGGGGHWVTLFDNVRVSALASIGGTNVLAPTIQLGAVFTGTVMSNGVTIATGASGTISFLTNSVGLSTNTLALGSATSATAILTPPYTVKAIYSGDGTYIGSTNTLTVSNAVATVTLGNLSQTYDGTAKSASATTTPAGLTVNVTYNGSANAPTNAGTYRVIATVSDPLYVGSATNNLVIAQAAATVTLGSLSQTYDGTAKSATATTTPPGLTVAFTYNGSPNAPTNVGTYVVVGTVVDVNYFGSATNNLVIGLNTAPPNITVHLSGNQLTITWPGDHVGWVLQSNVNLSIATGWMDVPGSQTNSQFVITIDPANPSVFFRLRLPVLPPANLQTFASGSTNAIGLDWSPSASPGVTGYRVFYGTTTNGVTNSIDVGNVTSAIISGLTPSQTYFMDVVALTAAGQSQTSAAISGQTDSNANIVPLFNASTALEPNTISNTPSGLITWISDRPRARHARESQFMLYDTFLPFYWEQRMTAIQIIDTFPQGGSTLTFNLSTLNALDQPNIRFFFQGITTVAQYSDNLFADQVDASGTNWTSTINANTTFNRPLQAGDRVEVEFSPFMLAATNGQLNYYGGAILYVVGQGIVPWQEGGPSNDPGSVNVALDSVPMPTNGWLAGAATMPYQYSAESNHVFNQLSPNAAPVSGEPFLLGRRLHHTDFGDGTHSEQPNPVYTEEIGKLGPTFVNRSCVACHANNGRALPPAIGALMLQSVVKVGSDASGTPDPVLGSIVQPQSTNGSPQDTVSIASYTTINGQYGDGTPYTLQKPNYVFSGYTPAFYSVRLAPQLVGIGLLEALSESTVLAMADPGDTNNDGISGRPQIVTDPQTGQPRLGRFGYKGGRARISHQIAGALNTDMGVTTSIFPTRNKQTNSGPIELADSDLANWVRYIAALGVNARRDLTNAQALHGEQLFASANCVQCHVPTLTTGPYHPMAELRNQTIHPYTDLLLHDMGTGLADNMGEGVATGSEWRTSPLWSIGLTAGVSGGEAYLHDGRARSLEEAILWHGGEAQAAEENFRNMSASDRAALISFLKSL
jgi:CxxC motif-containing protein (DUF1111 family)/fibronectin type 3 domain-containing protein